MDIPTTATAAATTSASAGPCDAAPDLAAGEALGVGVRAEIWPRISPAGLATVWTLTYDRPASMALLVVEKANHAKGGIGRGCDDLGGRGQGMQWSQGVTAPNQQGRTLRTPALTPIAAGPCTWHATRLVLKALVSRKATYIRLPATGCVAE